MKYIADSAGMIVGEKPDDFVLPETSGLVVVSAAEARLMPKAWEQPRDAAPAAAREISAADFMALFTAHEQSELWDADPRLRGGAIKVLAQGTANLDSDEAKNLMRLAVARGVLTQARADKILAGEPPS